MLRGLSRIGNRIAHMGAAPSNDVILGAAAASTAVLAAQTRSLGGVRGTKRKASAMARCDDENAILFVCDLQERFADLVYEFETVRNASSYLISVAATLEIPIVVTEQYPDRLGKTVPEISEVLPSAEDARCAVVEKTRFSMVVDDNPFRSFSGRRSVILCGIETHVCVMQTTLDLLEEGYDVFIVRDAVSSQRVNDRSAALQRLAAAGACVTTAESIVFDLLRDSKHPRFKEVSKLTKARASATNAFTSEA